MDYKCTSKKPSTIVIIACMVFCFGCGRNGNEMNSEKPEVKKIIKFLNDAEYAYRTNSLQKAMSSQLHYRDDLKEWQSSGRKGLQYDINLAIVNGRLAVMAENLGDTNTAEKYFAESARCFNLERKLLRQPETNFTHEAIRLRIEAWDGTNYIEWRHALTRVGKSNDSSIKH
jgi:hypothetical protein